MTRCLTDEQIDRLAASHGAAGAAHVGACDACRRRLEIARQNAMLLEDLAELDRSRERIRRLLDGGAAPSAAPSA